MMSSKGKVNQLNQQHSSMLFLGSHIAVNSAELVDKHAESISDNECQNVTEDALSTFSPPDLCDVSDKCR